MQLLRYLFIAASLDQKVEDVFIAAGNFYFIEINHGSV